MEDTRPYISTASGARLYLTGDPGYVPLDDMLWGIARECRFSNNVRRDVTHYSVAEHSWHIGQWAERYARMPAFAETGLSPEKFIRTAYLHDLQEGLLRDVPSPLKAVLPDYRAIEDRVCRWLADLYNLYYPLPPSIHLADKALSLIEAERLCARGMTADWPDEWRDFPLLGNTRLHCWDYRDAYWTLALTWPVNNLLRRGM